VPDGVVNKRNAKTVFEQGQQQDDYCGEKEEEAGRILQKRASGKF
jgi:hypothetical protein